jgi:hypothetical protein
MLLDKVLEVRTGRYEEKANSAESGASTVVQINEPVLRSLPNLETVSQHLSFP